MTGNPHFSDGVRSKIANANPPSLHKETLGNHGRRCRSRISIGASQSHRVPPLLPPPPLPKPLSPLLSLKPFTTFKYFARDQRRNRPPIKHSVLTKADVEKIMKEKSFDPSDFPRPYLTAKVVEDDIAIGGGYQK